MENKKPKQVNPNTAPPHEFIKYVDELETYVNKLEEQLRVYGVVKSLPTIKERNNELSEMLENYYEDEETELKKEFKFGFKHCFKWINDKVKE